MSEARRILVISALVFALTGCGEIEDFLHKGTHVGVQKCIDRNITEIISEEFIRVACVRKHEQSVEYNLGGRARYENVSDGYYDFEGHVKNKASNVIVTSFQVILEHDDAPTGVTDRKKFDNVWIEPNETYAFRIHSGELKFQPEDGKAKKEFFSWGIDEASTKGITISIE